MAKPTIRAGGAASRLARALARRYGQLAPPPILPMIHRHRRGYGRIFLRVLDASLPCRLAPASASGIGNFRVASAGSRRIEAALWCGQSGRIASIGWWSGFARPSAPLSSAATRVEIPGPAGRPGAANGVPARGRRCSAEEGAVAGLGPAASDAGRAAERLPTGPSPCRRTRRQTRSTTARPPRRPRRCGGPNPRPAVCRSVGCRSSG